MIHTNTFRVLRNAEFIQQGKDLIKTISDANTTTLGVKKQHDLFGSIITELDDVFKTSQKNPLTKILVEEDFKRDSIFMAICFIVDAHLKHWDPAVVAKATIIAESIKVYGRDLVDLNYQSESANLTSLIDTWENDTEMVAILTAFHIDSWKNELKATNNLFIKTYTERSQADGNAEALPKIKDLREKATTAWNKLERIILGKIEEFEDDATKAPIYKELENNINGVLDSYTNLILIREGKKAAKNAGNNDTPTA
jgi:Family of unknown function (DUF6261)